MFELPATSYFGGCCACWHACLGGLLAALVHYSHYGFLGNFWDDGAGYLFGWLFGRWIMYLNQWVNY